MLVDDVLQAVDTGLYFDELGLDEFVGFAVGFFPGSGRVVDVSLGQGIEEFDGAI